MFLDAIASPSIYLCQSVIHSCRFGDIAYPSFTSFLLALNDGAPTDRFWLLSGWCPPGTNRLKAAHPILTHFSYYVWRWAQHTHIWRHCMDRKDVRIMKNIQCLVGRDFSKLMECPLCWDRMIVMDEWKGKIRTTIWSLAGRADNNDFVTSADRRVVCDQVAAGFGELEREIFSIGLHIYIFNEPLRQR